MPKPVRPPPVMAPSSVWVKPYCSAHWPRMPARIEKPTPAAAIAMKPAQRSRWALTPAGEPASAVEWAECSGAFMRSRLRG